MHCPDEIYSACAQLTAAFAVLVDAHRYEELGALFTEDCTFERPGVKLTSRAEIVAFMSKRPRDQIARHCCAPPLIEPKDGAPATLKSIAAFAEYHDRFVQTPEGWKIAQRRVVPVMMAG